MGAALVLVAAAGARGFLAGAAFLALVVVLGARGFLVFTADVFFAATLGAGLAFCREKRVKSATICLKAM